MAGGFWVFLYPFLYSASRAGDAICIVLGSLVVMVAALFLKSYFPGASFLLLDQDGFTLRSYNRVQRLEWQSVSRMIAVGRSYERYGAHPSGIMIVPHGNRIPGFLIRDRYTLGRRELLPVMSRLAGPSVAIGFPVLSPQDRAFHTRMDRTGYWAFGLMFALVMAGFMVVELRKGKPLTELLPFFVGMLALVGLLAWINIKDGRNG